MDLARILEGDPEATRRLAARDVPTWQTLLEHLALERGTAAGRPLLDAWLALGSLEEWRSHASAAASRMESRVFATTKSALRGYDPWIEAGTASLPPLHPAALCARLASLAHPENPFDPERLSKLLALETDLLAADSPAMLAETLLLRANGADPDARLTLAERAERVFEALGDAPSVVRARNERAMALNLLGRLDEGHAILEALRPVGLLGVRLGRTLQGDSAACASALDEAAYVATWADPLTPAWVRALGGLAQAFADPELTGLFEGRLEALSALGDKGLAALAEVTRQALDRSLESVAFASAERLERAWPERLEGALASAPAFERRGQSQRARRFLVRAARAEPEHEEAALAWVGAAHLALLAGEATEALAQLDELRPIADPELALRAQVLRTRAQHSAAPADLGNALHALFTRTFADTDLMMATAAGHTLVDATIDALLALADVRAIQVAEAVHDAAVSRWGESPPTWLERHNLGSVCAQLGEVARGRALVEEALGQAKRGYDDHPDVLLMERTLARIAELERGGTYA